MSDSTSKKLKVLVAFGTRPEAIKLWPVIEELSKTDLIETTVLCTGQHRELIDLVLDPLDFQPDIKLELARVDPGLNELIAQLIPAVEEVIEQVRPDMIVVQGDTTGAMATAMVGFHLGIELAHVEAGLRSGDRRHPFPEEANRRVLGSLCGLHFAPTPRAAALLLREGVPESEIFVTGNTGIDALLQVLASPTRPRMPPEVAAIEDGRPVLITLHRRESWLPREGQGESSTILAGLFEALSLAARNHSEQVFVYPAHPNPRVRSLASRYLSGQSNLRVVEPLDYRCFAYLMGRARLILTDSGGIQEEAPSLGVPTLILRKTTERPEALEVSKNRLVGVDPEAVRTAIEDELSQPPPAIEGRPLPSPFGDGRAASRIRQLILHRLGRGLKPEPFEPARK
jgi:UDP-N-acetylglucosamine 2-epimerase (non-hydrolysing)